MPDFERITRDLEIYLAKNKEIVKARHRGEDKARREILILFVFCVIIFILSVLFVELKN